MYKHNEAVSYVRPSITGQPFPPPPLATCELLGYQLSLKENIEQFSEPDPSYPNLLFDEEAYREIVTVRKPEPRLGLTYKKKVKLGVYTRLFGSKK